MIEEIGRQGDLAAKARESLASLERLIQYAGLALPGPLAKGASRARLKLAGRDIRSLEDHVSFLNSKISFLLDATLGLISVQQNEVIRILTVATTVFFPPTLIGTIYGMNFKIPELSWALGYPYAIVLMAVSAVLPFFYFKRRGLAVGWAKAPKAQCPRVPSRVGTLSLCPPYFESFPIRQRTIQGYSTNPLQH